MESLTYVVKQLSTLSQYHNKSAFNTHKNDLTQFNLIMIFHHPLNKATSKMGQEININFIWIILF